MPAIQLIQLKSEQLEAIAMHLEQTALDIRNALSRNGPNSIWISDVQHIESILGSTDRFLREVKRSLENPDVASTESLQNRVGRPRRTRRRKP